MKKILSLLLSLTLTVGTCALTSCGLSSDLPGATNSESSSATERTFTVTFKQYNQTDIEKTVREGEALTDIPAPAARTGYTVEWDKTAADLASITQNITVNAIETPNAYTITYDAGEGSMAIDTQTVTYDSVVTLLQPEGREDYTFQGWTYNGNAVVSGSKWTIAESVTLEAVWQAKDMCEVAFIQNGKTIKTVKVEKGEDLNVADIPQTEAKTGYDVTWVYTAEQLKNIQGPLTIYAKETPKEYTLILKAGANGSVVKETLVLKYGSSYDLNALAKADLGYKLVRWERNGEAFVSIGTWTLDETNVELQCVYAKKVFTVTLNVNGGNALTTTVYTIEYGAQYKLPSDLTRKASGDTTYKFDSWRLGSVKGTKIANEGTWLYDLNEEITLYAKWDDGYTNNY